MVSLSDFFGISVNDLKSYISGGIGKNIFLFLLNLSVTWLLHNFMLIIWATASHSWSFSRSVSDKSEGYNSIPIRLVLKAWPSAQQRFEPWTFISPKTQGVKRTYIRHSKDVLDVFWTSYVRSIYVLCPGDYERKGSSHFFQELQSRDAFRTLLNIYDGAFFFENS